MDGQTEQPLANACSNSVRRTLKMAVLCNYVVSTNKQNRTTSVN